MADQELRDRNNRYLGKIVTRSDGKLELRDKGQAEQEQNRYFY